MTAVLVTLAVVVVAILVVLVVGIVQIRAQARTAPAPAAAVPHALDIAGRTPDGAARRIAIVESARPTVIVFLTSTCTTCATFWHALAAQDRSVPDDARLVVVTKGQDAERPARLRELAPPGIPVVMSSEAWTAYGVSTAPHFVFVDGSRGVVAEGAAPTWGDVVAACEHGAPRR